MSPTITRYLTLNAPIATKVVCFSRLLKCLRSLYGKQCGPRSDCSYRSICSGSMLFASILNLSVMLGNYLQQTPSSDNIFRCIFFLALKGFLFFSYINVIHHYKVLNHFFMTSHQWQIQRGFGSPLRQMISFSWRIFRKTGNNNKYLCRINQSNPPL